MRSSAMIPSLMNIMVIIFIFNIIIKALKKNKDKNQTNDKPPTVKHEGTQTFDRPKAQVRKNRFETKPVFNENLQLKRCHNCGGEIPLTMMKCELCGARQTGCGVTVFVVLFVLGILMAVIFTNNYDNVIWEHVQMFFQWLGSL